MENKPFLSSKTYNITTSQNKTHESDAYLANNKHIVFNNCIPKHLKILGKTEIRSKVRNHIKITKRGAKKKEGR